MSLYEAFEPQCNRVLNIISFAGTKISLCSCVCICVCVCVCVCACASAIIMCAKLRHLLLCDYSHERSYWKFVGSIGLGMSS